MTYTLLNHYLNQYLPIISEILLHSNEISFAANAQNIFPYNVSDNYTSKIIATYPRNQWI